RCLQVPGRASRISGQSRVSAIWSGNARPSRLRRRSAGRRRGASLGHVSHSARLDMQLVGTFQAQYFKLISTDPNTIFQFVVIPDRIFLLKVGSSLNQIPQILTKNLVGGAIGLKEHKVEQIPSIEQLQALVEKINNEKTLG